MESETLIHLLEEEAVVLRSLLEEVKGRFHTLERDRLGYEAEIGRIKAEYRAANEDVLYWQRQTKNTRSAWSEVCETLEAAHLANSALIDECDGLKAQIATMQAEISALRPEVDPAIEEAVQKRWAEIWNATAQPAQPAQPTPRRYRYEAPSAVYAPRRGRRVVRRKQSINMWVGGSQNAELTRLAWEERVYLTHRELARLQAFARVWDDVCAQMCDASIPW